MVPNAGCRTDHHLELPALIRTTHELIAYWAQRTPDAPAFLAPGRTALSYSRLYQSVLETTRSLAALGIGRGDRVAVVLPNGPEIAAVYLGVTARSVFAPLNPAYRAPEFEFYMDDLRTKVLLTLAGAETEAVDVAAKRGIPVIELSPREDLPAGLHEIKGAAAQAGDSLMPLSQPDDVALVLHTSGSTSRPKIVPLSHRNLCRSALNIARTLQLSPVDRTIAVMPFFHIHALVASTLASIASGGSVVIPAKFLASQFWEWVRAFRPTWYTGAPTFHQAILAWAKANPEVVAGHPFRFIRVGAAPLPPQLMMEMEEVYRVPVLEFLGMTEAAQQIARNPLPPGIRKPGSVGLPAGPEVGIMDEAGNFLPQGQTGEIVIRGENVTSGYERNPEANAKAYCHGWFRTGDEGYLDSEGYLYVTGRLKEMINRGGEKIIPREVDEALLEHPAVAQAMSFSIPHRTLGEEVGAVVVLKPGRSVTAAELRQFVAGRLSAFKIPRIVRIVEEIPKGPTGKLQRIGLAARLGIGALGESAVESEYVPPEGELETRLAQLWQETLRLGRVGAADDFFALGGDSLTAAEIITRLSLEEDLDLPHVALYEHPTLREFARAVERAGNDSPRDGAARRGLVPIRTTGGRTPLYCAPGHMNHFAMFARLARHLGPDQPVYGLPLPRLTAQKAYYSVEELVAHYVECIREIQPHGPYCFMGYCHGAYLVFEVARRMQSLGEPVGLLCLMDAYLGPGSAAPNAAFSEEHAEHARRRLSLHARALVGGSPSAKLRYLHDRIKSVLSKIGFRARLSLYACCVRNHLNMPAFLIRKDLASRYALRSYRPGTFHGDVLLVRTIDSRSEANLMGWRGWIDGNVSLLRIPGDPRGPATEECIAQYAPRLAEALAQAQPVSESTSGSALF